MNKLTTITLLTVVLAIGALGQPATTTDPNWLLTTGIGYKPYQTTIKAGSSAFIEGGKMITPGIYGFVRLDARSTDAQLIFEGCKTLFASPNVITMLCGGPGFGADANNVGVAFAGGGKLFYRINKVGKMSLGENTWLHFAVTVDKNTVPAPVSADATISPVQPNFRFGITKTF